ncbi:guanine deaminase [Celerinatantimonas sp. YJH-8]|uniref:guanine deaminase n=1 Tax=Celerinatantimonas sp. YJH-8 TaxID=3228714 RepID=UPI0038CB9A14
MTQQAFQGQLFYFVADPRLKGSQAWHYHADGILWIRDGKIVAAGDAASIKSQLPPTVPIQTLPDQLLMPGFIDTHIHYPQTEMIAAYGEQLLSWLNTYTFPTEQKFADPDYAAWVADIFLDQLLDNGTTTAMIFATVHPQSVDAIFQCAQARKLRIISGKVLMDRNAPPSLCDTPETGFSQTEALIRRWHGVDRLLYAITPRFAPTSSPEQLLRAQQLRACYPDVYLQTHLSENKDELAWVHRLFPDAKDYLDVYQQAGLLGPRSIFAHGIHLDESACTRLADSGSILAHCPSSNLFLGSGLFDLRRIQAHNIPVGIGSDVGAGTSFSMLKNLSDGYKVQQLRGVSLSAFEAFYLATLGGAKALSLDDKIGSFLPGREADFITLDLVATPFLKYRLSHCKNIEEILFALMMLGDDRMVSGTWIMGEKQSLHVRLD